MVKIHLRTRRLAVTLLTVLVGLALLSLIAWSARYWLGHRTSLESLLSLSAGQSLARWFSSLAWMGVGSLAVALALSSETARPVPRHQWVALVLLCTALSVEESTQLLDRMIGPLQSQWPAFTYSPWMLLAAALVVLVSLRRLMMGSHRRASRLLLAAGALYVAGRLSGTLLLAGYSGWLGPRAGVFVVGEVIGRLFAMMSPVLALSALGDELERQKITITIVPVSAGASRGSLTP